MNCRKHPEKPATGQCAGCGEEFCEDCLSQFSGKEYCAACLKAEAALASARLAGGGDELARMKKAMIGCAVVLMALVMIPMVLLIYPMFKLGDIGRCRDNLKRIHRALVTYAEQNDGQFPPDNNGLKPLFTGGCLADAGVFRCPGAKGVFGEMGDLASPAASARSFPPGSSYLYQGGLTLPRRGEAYKPLLWDRSTRNHRGKGINVLRTDGNVRFETKGLSRIRLRRIGKDR